MPRRTCLQFVPALVLALAGCLSALLAAAGKERIFFRSRIHP